MSSATAIGLKYLMGGTLRPQDVLLWLLGGAAWLAISPGLGWLQQRDRQR